MVKVSVVIPIYNVELYLRECLDSVVNQTLKEIEIICVDDGSTDSCPDILQEYEKRDSRIRVVTKENSGYGHSVNVGLDMARGEYISVVEPDDYADLNMLEELYQEAKQKNLDMIKADSRRFVEGDSGREFTYQPALSETNSCNYGRIFEWNDVYEKFSACMYTWAGIFRRDFLNDNHIRHNETPGASYQDNGFWFQTVMYAQRMMCWPHAYYNLRRDNPNSSALSKEKVFCISDEFDFIHKKIEESHLEIKDVLYKQCFYFRHLSNLWAMERIAPKYRQDLYERMRLDTQQALAAGEIAFERLSDTYRREVFTLLRQGIYREGWTKPELMITGHAAACLNKSKEIWIYGAGMHGERVFHRLEQLGCEDKIKGALVTSLDGNEKHFLGYPVQSIEQYRTSEEHIIIVAVGKKNSREVLQTLEEYQVENYITKDELFM